MAHRHCRDGQKATATQAHYSLDFRLQEVGADREVEPRMPFFFWSHSRSLFEV